MNNKKEKKINLALIKKLRKITDAGILECKKSLINSNGNIELAIINLRKSGKTKAIKKNNFFTKHGMIFIKLVNKQAAMIELNCQTDFVAQNKYFQDFGNKILSFIIDYPTNDINHLKKIFEDKKNILISKLGENIKINKIINIYGKELNYYLHNNMKIGVIIDVKNMNKELSKKIAMHIAANKPEYIYPDDISQDRLNYEEDIQREISNKISKKDFIAKKILNGKMQKFKEEISLICQKFIFDTKKTVNQILKENNSKINNFVRFEIGENVR